MITVEKIEGGKKLTQFIDFPHDLYKDDPNYVPELYMAQKDLLSKKHPFFEHSKLDLFLAYKDGKIAGRIAAIRNNNHINFTGRKEGFFGFFESIEDYAVAEKLFDTACEWVKKEGLTNIVGPTNYSTNETCGWLINAFDQPPVLSMTYNKKYFLDYATRYGMKKHVDLYAWLITDQSVSEKSLKVAEAFENRLKSKGITIRTINMKDFKTEVDNSQKVYNLAWEKNMGFVPMTEKEFRHLCFSMKQIMDPALCYVAEHGGKMVGFCYSLPDFNQILIDVKRGRLFPTGIFKLLFGKKKINRIRTAVLGVVEGYRKLGIEAIFYARTIKYCKSHGMRAAEASWILENNEMMNQAAKNMNGNLYKTYRLYEKAL
jgi:hypothetical protein